MGQPEPDVIVKRATVAAYVVVDKSGRLAGVQDHPDLRSVGLMGVIKTPFDTDRLEPAIIVVIYHTPGAPR